jgi:hypothetical protein
LEERRSLEGHHGHDSSQLRHWQHWRALGLHTPRTPPRLADSEKCTRRKTTPAQCDKNAWDRVSKGGQFAKHRHCAPLYHCGDVCAGKVPRRYVQRRATRGYPRERRLRRPRCFQEQAKNKQLLQVTSVPSSYISQWSLARDSLESDFKLQVQVVVAEPSLRLTGTVWSHCGRDEVGAASGCLSELVPAMLAGMQPGMQWS